MAEMGDKTQFMTLAMSSKHSAIVVLTGVSLGTMLISLISVALGKSAGSFLSYFWINLLAGVAFIGFGLWGLRGEAEEEAEADANEATKNDHPDSPKKGKLRPILTVATAFFIAELGDKTMLATVVIAGRAHEHFWQVWAGSTLGLVLSNALGIVAGKALASRLSAKTMQYTIAVVYVISGILALIEAFKK